MTRKYDGGGEEDSKCAAGLALGEKGKSSNAVAYDCMVTEALHQYADKQLLPRAVVKGSTAQALIKEVL
jgi:hypothetical protein